MRYIFLLLCPLMLFSQESTLVGDVNCDGEITSQDASFILQFITNNMEELPCEENMIGLTPDQLQEIINMMDEQLSVNYNIGNNIGSNIFFPEGINGEGITYSINGSQDTYLVPDNKRLYITNIYDPAGPTSTGVNIIGIGQIAKGVNYGDSSYEGNYSLGMPIILNSGQEIGTSDSESATINGILVDELTGIEGITAIITGQQESAYTVPESKRLYITNIYDPAGSGSGSVYVVGIGGIAKGTNYVSLLSGDEYGNYSLSLPIVLNSGETIGTSDSEQATINGYLIDENYFSNNQPDNNQNNTGNSNINTLIYTIDGF